MANGGTGWWPDTAQATQPADLTPDAIKLSAGTGSAETPGAGAATISAQTFDVSKDSYREVAYWVTFDWSALNNDDTIELRVTATGDIGTVSPQYIQITVSKAPSTADPLLGALNSLGVGR